MDHPIDKIVKSYRFIYDECCGGHIFVHDDGTANLVHTRNAEGNEYREPFSGDAEETALEKARRFVLENIDAEAKFYDAQDDLDLTKWIAKN